MTMSKSVQPASMRSARSSEPTNSAPASLGLAGLVALGEDGDGDVAAGAVRQRERAAELLVGVTDVDAEPDVDLDGLVEAGAGGLLEQRDGLGRLVVMVAVDLLVGGAEPLASLVGHGSSFPPRRRPSSGRCRR